MSARYRNRAAQLKALFDHAYHRHAYHRKHVDTIFRRVFGKN